MDTYRIPGAGFDLVEVIDDAGHADSYRIGAVCLNCKWEGQARIARGQRTRATGYDCPACDCRTVSPTTLKGRDTPGDGDSRTFLARDLEARREARLPF